MSRAAVYLKDPVTQQERLLGAVDGEASIGRDSGARVRLDDLRCSGLHALLEPTENKDEFQLIDLGSYFGTYVRGRKIQESRLRYGDTFKIGNQLLVLRPGQGIPQTVDASAPSNISSQHHKTTDTGISLITERNLLQVTLFWGDTSLDVRTFRGGSDVTIGTQREATFGVSLSDPKHQKTPYRIARYRSGQLQLRLPAESTGLVWIGNDTFSLDMLRHKDKSTTEFGELEVFLRVGDRADIFIGELTLSFRFVNPAEKVPFSFFDRLDRRFLIILAGLLALYGVVFMILTMTNVQQKETTLKDVPKHLRRIVFDAGIEKAIQRQKAAIGQLANNLEGGRAKMEEGRAKARKELAPQKQKQQKKLVQKVTPTKQKGPVAPKVDLDAAFSTPTERPVLQNVAMVGKPQAGNTAAALADGGFARGTKGEGAGGGGKSVGIGQLSGYSTGGGMGAGDYGLAPSKGREIKIPETEEIVILGGLDPDVIAAIIRRYLPQIQHCYEQQLALNPGLKGKVTVSFVISGTGSVKSATVAESSLSNSATEACITEKIMKWEFPKPKGGGSVGVKYPFLLMSNTGN